MTHLGVDLRQAVCYLTALDSTGRSLQARPVESKPVALRRCLRGFSEPGKVEVEACSFWLGFKEAIEKEVPEIRLVHPRRCGSYRQKR